MIKKSLILACAAAASVLVVSASEDLRGAPEGDRLAGHEPNTYRYGAPLMSEVGTTPEACEKVCNANEACAAWSLVPQVYEREARCELKRHIGRAVPHPGAVSGIAGKFQPPPPVEVAPETDAEAPAAPSAKPSPRTNKDPQPVMAAQAPLGDLPIIFRPNEAALEGAPAAAVDLTPDPAPRPEPAPTPKPAD